MSHVLKISEAASIGIHAMTAIAEASPHPVNTRHIARLFQVSENHCSKIMQRLTRTGFISAVRGPKGGFILKKPATEVTVLQIYEAIDGPLGETTCLFNRQSRHPCCGLFKTMIKDVNKLVKKNFGNVTLADVVNGININKDFFCCKTQKE